MDAYQYRRAVRELLESGKATDQQWNDVTRVVLRASEDYDGVPSIDEVILDQQRGE